MNLKKALKLIGIEPTRKLNSIEINKIIKKFVKALIITFPEQNINTNEAIEKMYNCKMYFANFPENLGTANYFYKNRTIYYKYGTSFEKLDDYMLHELIHYFQDNRDKNGKLSQMGLCTFGEFKIYGMAINEAAVQYLAAKMLNYKVTEINYCEVTAKTISKNYYPLLCNLIMQMTYLVGEKLLINSTLFSDDEFIYSFMDIAGESATKEIQVGFDVLLEAEQQLLKIKDIEKRKFKEKEINNLYEKVQNKILTSYFEGMLPLIETVDEAEEYRNKLKGYKKVIGNVDSFKFYEEYKQKQMEKLDKKIILISRKNSENMLKVVNNNKIFSIFRLIRKFFYTKDEEYKN